MATSSRCVGACLPCRPSDVVLPAHVPRTAIDHACPLVHAHGGVCSTGFLLGPMRQLKNMFHKKRVITTCVYLVALILTLVVAFAVRGYVLSAVRVRAVASTALLRAIVTPSCKAWPVGAAYLTRVCACCDTRCAGPPSAWGLHRPRTLPSRWCASSSSSWRSSGTVLTRQRARHTLMFVRQCTHHVLTSFGCRGLSVPRAVAQVRSQLHSVRPQHCQEVHDQLLFVDAHQQHREAWTESRARSSATLFAREARG